MLFIVSPCFALLFPFYVIVWLMTCRIVLLACCFPFFAIVSLMDFVNFAALLFRFIRTNIWIEWMSVLNYNCEFFSSELSVVLPFLNEMKPFSWMHCSVLISLWKTDHSTSFAQICKTIEWKNKKIDFTIRCDKICTKSAKMQSLCIHSGLWYLLLMKYQNQQIDKTIFQLL